MIASFIDGRIRIRGENLKSQAVINEIKQIAKIKGITDVSANKRTGSVLILYDIAVFRLEQILNMLSDFLDISDVLADIPAAVSVPQKASRRQISRIVPNRILNIGMLASLAGSLFGVAVGVKFFHVAAGFLFLGFLAVHIFKYKNMLFV